jgi:hypothetical protein
VRPPDDQLARLAASHVLAVAVDDAHAAVEDRPADGADETRRLLVGHGVAVDADLGQAIPLAKHASLGRAPGVTERRRAGRAAAEEGAHGAEVGRGERGAVQPHLEQGRHAQDDGAALALDQG